MRFLSLEMAQFGRFDRAALDLSAPAPALHIVHGPNEAGKSTTLTAIGDLLFGIPARSPLNFRYKYADMRLGAALQGADGSRLAIRRRKGNSDTLLDAEGAPLPEARLTALLRNIDRAGFERLFALDGERLRAGAAAMLSAKGAADESLFQAGAGLSAVTGVLERLQGSADKIGSLARRSASKPLWQAVDSWTEAQRQLKAEALSPAAWREASEAVAAAEAALAAIQAEFRDLTAEQGRLERQRRTAPILRRIDAARTALAELGALPALPADFDAQWSAAQQARQAALHSIDRTRTEAADLAGQLQALPPGALWLGHGTTIERLHKRSGEIATAQRDIPKLRGQLDRTEAQLAGLARQLGLGNDPDWAVLTVPSRAALAAIAALMERHAALEAAQRLQAEEAARLEADRRALAPVPEMPPVDPAAAARLLQQAAALAPTRTALDAAAAEAATKRARADTALSRLPWWTGSLAALRIAPIPAADAVRRLEERQATLERKGEAQQEELTRLRAEKADCLQALAQLQAAGPVPTADAVAAARAERDGLWQRFRTEALAQRATATGADGVAKALHAADDLSDRRQAEAERAALLAQLLAQRARLEGRIDTVAAEAEALLLGADSLAADWAALWQMTGIAPQLGSDGAAWLGYRAGVLELAEEAEGAARQSARLQAAEAEAAALWQRVFPALGSAAPEPAAPQDLRMAAEAAVAAAQSAWDRLQRDADSRARLARDSARVQDALSALAQQRKAWAADWQRALAPLALAADSPPAAATAQCDLWNAVIEQLPMREEHVRRLAGLRQDLQALEAEVTGFCQSLPAELACQLPTDSDAEALAQALNGLLRAAREVETLRTRIQADAARTAREAADAAQALAHAESDLTALRTLAGVTEDPAIAPLREAMRTQAAERSALAAAERELLEQGAGLDADMLRAEAESLPADAREARLAAAAARLDIVASELQAASASLTTARSSLAAMQARAGVGDIAQAQADAAATVGELVQDSLRLQAAHLVLGRAMELYRSANQHPLIARASDLLAAVAVGGNPALVGLEVDYSGDQPALKGRRAGGELVPVEGMSSGTRDQLFLCLRLAAVELWIDRHGPLPFIADDLFTTFDEARTLAGLRMLAALAHRTQVLVFTHHAHVAELAREATPGGACIVHALAEAGQSATALQPASSLF